MPLKDNKSWADPISNRIQILIQKMYLRVTCRKGKGKRGATLACSVALSIVSSSVSLSWGVTRN